jgi:ATP-dependent Clp protease ATP-binding subunit ClpA
VIQQRLQNQLATEMLEGKHAPGSTVRVEFSDGSFQFHSQEPAVAAVDAT